MTAGGTDLVTFASDTETYTAMVANDVAEVTVTATKNDSGASIDYLDGSDMTLDDADTAADGHQVTLAEGDNVIKVKVTSADGNATKTYTVTVNRAAAASTCTLNTGDLWCGEVTVGTVNFEGIGNTANGFTQGVGSLSDTALPVGTNDYTIDAVWVGASSEAGILFFSLTSALTTADKAGLVLHIDGNSDTFAFSGAGGPSSSITYNWESTGLDWSSTSKVTLRLREGTGTPSTPELSVAGASATEGGTMTFPVTLSEAVTDNVTATWTASFGSNEEDAAAADLASTTGTLTIGGGDTAGTFTVTAAGDSTDEHDETFTVTLSGVSSNAQLATDPTATGTITDDDDPPTLSVADVSVSEARGWAEFTITLSAASGKTVMVTMTAAADSGDTAESPADFAELVNSYNFSPGVLTINQRIVLVDDTLVEPDETFTVTLSNATNAVISDSTATGTITNDDMAASTCTLNTGDLWCGVVTVGDDQAFPGETHCIRIHYNCRCPVRHRVHCRNERLHD